MAKFSDKLAKKRKENNLSQEQLADRLNMSRQAVSKWESGSSYPDMEKIMEICKVLDCTLEDLLDDGTIKGQTNTRSSFNDVMKDFLNFITRSYNMIWSMSLKDKLVFLIEMIFISIILLVMFEIIGTLAKQAIYPIINFLPYGRHAVMSVFVAIYRIVSLVLSTIVFIHLYKIRYLDYYITVSDNEVAAKTVEEPIGENKNIREDKQGNLIYEKKKEKVIIRDPKHSGYSFISSLADVLLIFIKVMAAFLAIPILVVFVLLIVAFTLSLVVSSSGTIFLTIAFAIAGGALITFLVIEVIFRLLFNKQNNLFRLFIMFMIGLVMVGVGTGLTVAELGTYKIEDVTSSKSYKTKTVTEVYDYSDDLVLHFLYNASNEVIIDNNADRITVEVTCFEALKCNIENSKDEKFKHVTYTVGNNLKFKEIYKIITDGIKNKVLYAGTSSPIKTKITLSQENYQKIKEIHSEYHGNYRYYYND